MLRAELLSIFFFTLTITDENGDVAQALLRLAEQCFNVFNEPDSKDGMTLSSPLTFLRIVRQVQPLVRGGGKADSGVTLL